jgi:flagellar basal-body rod modification protein FlgD
MPKMGRPVSNSRNPFKKVTMAPKNSAAKLEDRKLSKEQLLNKITGRKAVDPKHNRNIKNKMGKDEFLKLLTHQLENQDPMKPMDQAKFSGELAQFSQLEQLSNLNRKFDKMGKDADMQNQFYAASFIGKEVITSGNSLKIEKGDSGGDIIFNLPEKAKQVLVRIFDEKNQMVGEIRENNVSRGGNRLKWDGVRLDGGQAGSGNFNVQVMGWNEQLQPMTINTQNKGVVQSVSFEDGAPVLVVDNKKVFLRDVKSFHLAKNGKTSHNTNRQPADVSKKILRPNAHLARELGGMHQNGGRTIKETKKPTAQQATNAYDSGAEGIYD